MKRYSAGLAIASAASVLLTGCMDQGPMDHLRTTMSAMDIPTQLQPAKLSPWKNFDWTTLEMDNGSQALTWEGPRGIDNDTAWLVSGWTVQTQTGSSDTGQDQACETLITVAEQNAPEQDPRAATALNRCQNKKWPSGRTFDLPWDVTTDGVSIRATAVLQRTPADGFSMYLYVRER